MVLLVTTPTILAALETLPPSRREALDLPDAPELGAPISHEQLIRLGRYFREKRVKREQEKRKREREQEQEQKQESGLELRLGSEEQQGTRGIRSGGKEDLGSTEEDEKDGKDESANQDQNEVKDEDGHGDSEGVEGSRSRSGSDKDEGENEHVHEHGHEHGDKHEKDTNRNENENENDEEDVDDAAAQTYTLNTLLRGTKVYVPPPPPKPQPSPEYLALKARLQAAAEADAYNRLLSPPRPTSVPGPSPIFASSTPTLAALHDPRNSTGEGEEGDGDNDPLTPTLVVNIFLSVLLTGFSAYWALTNFQTPAFLTFSSSSSSSSSVSTGRASTGVGAASEPVRVLLSLFAALLVGVAEVVVYAAYLRKVREARARERKIKERKVVIGPVPDPDPRDDGSRGRDGGGEKETRITEKEEIWGRGVNGGVRRRVRERWDREERKREEEEGKEKEKDEKDK